MLVEVEKAYDVVFPADSAGERFFDDLDSAYAEYCERTKRRPLKPREIEAAARIFKDQCREAMQRARKT